MGVWGASRLACALGLATWGSGPDPEPNSIKHTFDAVADFKNILQKIDACARQFWNNNFDPLYLRRNISLDEFFVENIFVPSDDELFHLDPVGDGIEHHVMQMIARLSEATEFGQRQIFANHHPQLGR